MKPADVEKIKKLAAELPQVYEFKSSVIPYEVAKQHYIGAKEKGMNVATIPHPVNHYQNLKKAFKKGGNAAIEKYVEATFKIHKEQREKERRQLKEIKNIQTV